ncbi:MAG: FAD-dependent oxidoreductase, partial [Pirellulaceae bacterium]|nr:FAD-dependent oxidoreductase [Pirellulaceae bacterium]
MMERSCSKHVVLLGIGHTNAHIVRKWGMEPLDDTDLTCISDHPIATYSGRLPAVLAGQIPASEMEIDLVRLCSSVGARLIIGQVTGIDHEARQLLFADRPSIAFDALSIGIGSVPTISGVTISGDSLIKIKPMQTFLDRLAAQVRRAQEQSKSEPLRVVVVGSGVAGVEITFCLPPFLAVHADRPVTQQLVTRSDLVLPDASASMRAKVVAEIDRRGVTVKTGAGVTEVHPGTV